MKHDVNIALKVVGDDDKVDALFVNIKESLIKIISEDPRNGESAIDLIMVAKYFERIGDHAVNIAQWVIYSITGSHMEEDRV